MVINTRVTIRVEYLNGEDMMRYESVHRFKDPLHDGTRAALARATFKHGTQELYKELLTAHEAGDPSVSVVELDRTYRDENGKWSRNRPPPPADISDAGPLEPEYGIPVKRRGRRRKVHPNQGELFN